MIKRVYNCSGCHIYPSYGNGVILSWKSLVGKFENPYCGRDVSEWQWKVKPLSVKATGLYSWSSPSITRITSAPKRWIPPPQCLFYPKLNLAGAAPFFISLNRVEPVATVPPAMKASWQRWLTRSMSYQPVYTVLLWTHTSKCMLCILTSTVIVARVRRTALCKQ